MRRGASGHTSRMETRSIAEIISVYAVILSEASLRAQSKNPWPDRKTSLLFPRDFFTPFQLPRSFHSAQNDGSSGKLFRQLH